jgi:hypothetical protein
MRFTRFSTEKALRSWSLLACAELDGTCRVVVLEFLLLFFLDGDGKHVRTGVRFYAAEYRMEEVE